MARPDPDRHKTALVDELPVCDFCAEQGLGNPATYDGKTRYGPWANMCQRHFDRHGLGLGLGVGQRLELRS